MFMPQRFIEPTTVPFGWAVKSLDGHDKRWDRLRKKFALKDGQTEVISGSGFLSYVVRVIFTFHGTEERFSAILKVPTVEKMRSADLLRGDMDVQFDVFLIQVHNQEILFYKHIAEKCDVFYFPKMYGSVVSDGNNAAHGRILVEDVGDRGVLPDVLKGLNYKQCSEALQVLARFHAFSYINVTDDFLEKIKHVATKRAEEDHFELSPAVFNLDPFFTENEAMMRKIEAAHGYIEHDTHKLYEISPILTHGDFWGNNMFFEKQIDGTAGEKLFTIFDWQLLQPGTGMTDIAKLLATSADEDVLKDHIDDLLKLYYDTMKESLREKGVKMPYDFEKMQKMFRRQFPTDFLFGVLVLSALLQQAEDPNSKVLQGVVNRLKLGFHYAVGCMET